MGESKIFTIKKYHLKNVQLEKITNSKLNLVKIKTIKSIAPTLPKMILFTQINIQKSFHGTD